MGFLEKQVIWNLERMSSSCMYKGIQELFKAISNFKIANPNFIHRSSDHNAKSQVSIGSRFKIPISKPLSSS